MFWNNTNKYKIIIMFYGDIIEEQEKLLAKRKKEIETLKLKMCHLKKDLKYEYKMDMYYDYYIKDQNLKRF